MSDKTESPLLASNRDRVIEAADEMKERLDLFAYEYCKEFGPESSPAEIMLYNGALSLWSEVDTALKVTTESLSANCKECHGKLDYYEAARVVHLYLDKFCDKSVAYPDMIADAARKASARITELESERSSKGIDVVVTGTVIDPRDMTEVEPRDKWRALTVDQAAEQVMKTQEKTLLKLRIAELEAQNQRLREALTQLADRVEEYACAGCIESYGYESDKSDKPSLSDVIDNAREALK
jgi:hypothetical protein